MRGLLAQERTLTMLVALMAQGRDVIKSLGEMETLLAEPDFDYNIYGSRPERTLDNSMKILLVCTFLLRLLESYRQPAYKSTTGARTNFQNEEVQRKFEERKLKFRSQMLSVFRILHESHIIFAKVILEKVAVGKNLSDEAIEQLTMLGDVVTRNMAAVKGQATGVTLA